VPWRDGVINIILLHTHTHTHTDTPHTHTHRHTHTPHTQTLTHTHIMLSQHFTSNFSLHTTRYSHATPSLTEKDLRLLSFVPVYRNALSFPVCFSRWGIENFYMVFPYSVKERVTKTEIFQRLSKNA
jgi:hypothetical protein